MGLHSGLFPAGEEYFKEFLKENINTPKAEFFIPLMVNKLITEGTSRVKVLHTSARWFGVTYAADSSRSALLRSGPRDRRGRHRCRSPRSLSAVSRGAAHGCTRGSRAWSSPFVGGRSVGRCERAHPPTTVPSSTGSGPHPQEPPPSMKPKAGLTLMSTR